MSIAGQLISTSLGLADLHISTSWGLADLHIGHHMVFVYIIGLQVHTILFSYRFYNVLYFYIFFQYV
jgi:hypothetical protein